MEYHLLPFIGMTSTLWAEYNWMTTILTVFAAFITWRLFKFLDSLKAVSFLPGLRLPFHPLSFAGAVLPESIWNPGLLFTWNWRHTRNMYRQYGKDTVSVVPFFLGAPTLYTQSLDVARQVVSAGHRSAVFGKIDSMSAAFLFWGPNIIAADREVWRKHRRIMGPAFNNETYSLVWSTSQQLYADMLAAEGWNSRNTIDVASMQTLTFKFSLLIFASCGFGLPFTWIDPPSHGDISVQECVQTIARTNVFAVTAPWWAWKLPVPWVRRTRRAYDSMRAFMHTQVSERRKAMHEGGRDNGSGKAKDIFSLLVQASEGKGNEKMALNDDELIGNIFTLMFAGHETTTQTLAATLGFLALHDDVQEEVAAQVKDVAKSHGKEAGGSSQLLKDYSRLDKVLAAYYEGVRMFPSGLFLLREAKQDTVLTLDGDAGKRIVLPLKRGTQIVVDMVGVQYNPKYFTKPDLYLPSRWYGKKGDGDKDLTEAEAFTAFSVGPRACIGSKFATTEAVCFLSLLLRDWRVEPLLATVPVTATADRDGEGLKERKETREEWRDRVMQATLTLAMGVRDVPLRFTRREIL
ncbi:cytochrome P450 [Leucogyrophana mollusca]|uniref:Cytochrome P450 n=1 Tax=Leucogyrophana mollusca TaxID=85980 RepID=A0ACB8B2T7_9AGAM|nr:cytochrome P450 [Leucogyrophana mollusca]